MTNPPIDPKREEVTKPNPTPPQKKKTGKAKPISPMLAEAVASGATRNIYLGGVPPHASTEHLVQVTPL